MSAAADVLRQFWLPGINEVSGRSEQGLVDWLHAGKYQIYQPIAADDFRLTSRPPKAGLPAFASDATRMATAAFESWHVIARDAELPKSIAWLIIRTYYSAFFAGHSIIRMLGESCTWIERPTTEVVRQVADLFGMAAVPAIHAGLYRCSYDSTLGVLVCKSLSGSRGGAHERFWQMFFDVLKDVGKRMLHDGVGLVGTRQAVSGKLDELCTNLSDSGRLRGTWLTEVRNLVNYRHKLQSWFPYGDSKDYYDSLYRVASCWKNDPMTVNLRLGSARELERFIVTCGFVVALARSLVKDMERRCPTGRSFHSYGAGGILSLIKVE